MIMARLSKVRCAWLHVCVHVHACTNAHVFKRRLVYTHARMLLHSFFAIGVHLPICAHTPAHACTHANVFATRPGREDTDDTNCLTVQTATLDSRVAGSMSTPRLYDDIGRQDDENATPDARSPIMAILSRQNAHMKRSCVRGDDIGG